MLTYYLHLLFQLLNRVDLTGILNSSKQRDSERWKGIKYANCIRSKCSLRCYKPQLVLFFYGILIPNAINRMPWIAEDKWNDVPFSKVKCEMYGGILWALESFKMYIKIIKYLRHTSGTFLKLVLLLFFLFLFFFSPAFDLRKRSLMWNVKVRRSSAVDVSRKYFDYAIIVWENFNFSLT